MAPDMVASTDIVLGLCVLFPVQCLLCTMMFPCTMPFLCNVLFPCNSFSVVLCSADFLFSCWLVLECHLRLVCHSRPAKDRGILLQIYCSILSACPHMRSILFVSIRCVLSREPFPLDLVLFFQPAWQYQGRIYPQMRVLDYRRELSFCSHNNFAGRVMFCQWSLQLEFLRFRVLNLAL